MQMQRPQQQAASTSSSQLLLRDALLSLQAQQRLAQNNMSAQESLDQSDQQQFSKEQVETMKESINGQNADQYSIMDQHMIDEKQGIPSKKCNCRQSQCIKLYCECYAAGAYCNGCHCVGCKNNDQSEGWRNKAIQNTLVKNPQAFLPKISQKQQEPSKEVDPLNLGKHNKGCACKKSGCMKKYCECFQAGVPCSENCKCSACQNVGFLSHGNLLRQFREEEGYSQQSQILHKFLLAHNEEHLNTILGDQTSEGGQKRGIPIKQEFIEESCMKLLQILHLPEEQILLQQQQQNTMEVENNNNAEATKPSKTNNSSQIGQNQLTMKTPQKVENQAEKSNPTSSCDIDMACQDEKIDEEEEREDQIENPMEQSSACDVEEEENKEQIDKEKEQEEQGIVKNEISEKEQQQQQHSEEKLTQEGEVKESQKDQDQSQDNLNNTNIEVEHHSSAVKRRQQLFELRRTMILDTFLQLLRTIENQV